MLNMDFIINMLVSILILVAVACLPINIWYITYCVIIIISLVIVEYIYNLILEDGE